jgi:acyl-coenzyme A thioesterase PaaI-like protein
MNEIVAINLINSGVFGTAHGGTSCNAADYLLPEDR